MGARGPYNGPRALRTIGRGGTRRPTGVDPAILPSREVPPTDRVSDEGLAGKAARIVMAEITDGALHGSPTARQEMTALQNGLTWLLSGEDVTSFGVQEFPGNAADDVAAKRAVITEYLARLGNVQNSITGEANG
jgi:hypothetical protein